VIIIHKEFVSMDHQINDYFVWKEENVQKAEISLFYLATFFDPQSYHLSAFHDP
jgi:hypothetical protein